jgi:hypothetical protein
LLACDLAFTLWKSLRPDVPGYDRVETAVGATAAGVKLFVFVQYTTQPLSFAGTIAACQTVLPRECCTLNAEDGAGGRSGAVDEWSPRDIVTNSWFDCQSSAGMWYNAQALDVVNAVVTVSFKGYMRDFTEDVKLSELYRFANLGSKATGTVCCELGHGAVDKLVQHQVVCLLPLSRRQTC